MGPVNLLNLKIDLRLWFSSDVAPKRNFRLLSLSLAVLLSLAIVSCSDKSDNNTRTHTMGNGAYRVTVRVPNEYIDFPYTSIGDESGFIQAYYPGNAPLPDTYENLAAADLWEKNILILFTSRSKYPEYNVNKTLEAFKALYRTDRRATDGDLTKFDQSLPADAHKDDLWVSQDSGNGAVLIKCLDDHSGAKAPQCTLYFSDDIFVYEVDFNKKYFPDWALIESNSHALIRSFIK
jgi:hypothetical protein